MNRSQGLRWGAAMFALLLALLTPQASKADSDDARRSEISKKGQQLFKKTKNHCKSLSDLVAFAVTKTDGPYQLVEDLKFVLIGKDLRDRRSGPYYIGKVEGATGDSGFKAELRDQSPQVEHAWAAIYVGRNYPPGSAEAAALATEVMGPLTGSGELNTADILLWSLGGDTGQRLSTSNYGELPNVIKRIMCE